MLSKYPKFYQHFILWAALLLSVAGVKADVYHWLGHNPNWNDLQNWQVEGAAASALPGPSDHVVVGYQTQGTDIGFTQNVRLASLTIIDLRAYRLSATGKKTLQIGTGLHLSAGTRLSSGLRILMGAEGQSTGRLSCDEALLSAIDFYPDAAKTGFQYSKPEAGMRSCGAFTIIPETTNPTCNGSSDGVAGVEVPSDGVGPFTYQWVGGPTTRFWTGVGAGTYTVIVIDLGQGGVPCSQDIFVNEPGPLTVFAMNGTPPNCFGECNGGAAPVVIGGNGGYTLTWSSGETGPVASALCSTYNLSILDQLGCAFSQEFTFPDSPDQITIDADVQNVTCNGEDDGAISLNILGGVGSYTISWTGPNGFVSGSAAIDNLEPGSYNASVSDDNACEVMTSYNISQPQPLNATATVLGSTCPDGSDGAININIAGGTPTFIIAWSGPNAFVSSTQNISGLQAGDYNLLITDANNCTFNSTYAVTAPDAILVTATVTDVLCFEEVTGSLSANATGGNGGLSYAWTGPDGFTANGPSISALAAGTFQVVVSDASGCTQTEDFDVAQPDLLEADIAAQPISCVGNGDGQIMTIPQGGVAPYVYAWTGPGGFTSADPNLASLQPGNYNLVMTDDNGCEYSASVVVPDAQAITISATVTNTTCANGNTGEIEISITGGAEPLSFSWTGPLGYTSSDQNIANLAAGNYTLVVTDAETCSSNATFTVSSPAALAGNFNIVPAGCFGGSDGAITSAPSGGTGPYSYLWIGPAGFFSTSQNISNLLSGTYTLQLTDANGCSAFLEALVPQQPQINVTRLITNVTCFGGSNGAINITASGGTPGYTYFWTGPDGFNSTSEDISGVVAGAYQVTVTDVNGCTSVRNYNITQPAQIVLAANVNNVVCAGDNDGSISASLSSGAGPFTYAWIGPGGFTATGLNISNLFAGLYTITATNTAGCQGTAAFIVEESSVITLDASVQDMGCFGVVDGAINLTVDGGQDPIAISWQGPNGFTSADLTLSDLEAGDYTVQVTDDFGCSQMATYTVVEPALLEVTLNPLDISCFGLLDGAISSAVTGGTAPYTYTWSGPAGFVSNDEDIDSLGEGSYSLIVTDAAGCAATASADVITPPLLTVSLSEVLPGCLANDGEITATPAGGSVAGAYTYQWSTSGGNPIGNAASISNLAPGTYTVTVSDDNGCQAVATLQLLRESINLSASLSNASCAGGSDGQITVNPTSGTAPFTFTWNGPDGFGSGNQAIAGLVAGTYTLQVSDAAGCILNESYDVAEPQPIALNPTVSPETCAGAGNGQITLNASGGSPGYLYSWSGPDGFSSAGASASGLIAGTYQVQVTDVNACETSVDIELELDVEIEIVLDINGPNCAAEPTGTAATMVSGGLAPYNYTWSGPNGFTSTEPSLLDLFAGSYQLQVVDAAGCQAQAEFEFVEPDSILVSLDISNATCLESNGSATATATGGTGDLSYSWADDDGLVLSTTNELTAVPAGIYTVIVSDEAGCSVESVVAVSDANGMVSGTITPVTCNGGADGAITTVVEDGQAPFTYNWIGPNGFSSSDADVNDLTAGNYTIAVTDDNGCLYAAEFLVTAPALISANLAILPVSCLGNDGAIAISIAGGTPDYTVQWSGPDGFEATGTTIDNLTIGTYDYSIEDANGCLLASSTEVILSPDIDVDATLISPLCGDVNDGSIALEVSGGTSPYTFEWAGPDGFASASQDIDDLAGGPYSLVVTDANDCEVSFAYELSQPDSLTIAFDVVEPACGEANGSIQAQIDGGLAAGPYWINWTDGFANDLGGSNPLENLAPGTYTLTVVDDNGCQAIASWNLTNPGIGTQSTVVNVSCNNFADGSIDLEVTSDNPPFTVTWSGPEGFSSTEFFLNDLVPGTYNYVVTASDGCTTAGSAVVLNMPAIAAIASLVPSCFGESNGSVSLELLNAVDPFTVLWTDVDGIAIGSDTNISGLQAGIYTFAVSDGNGCSLVEDVEIESAEEIGIAFTTTDVSCNGQNDGQLEVMVSGGVAPYTLAWTGPDGFNASDESLVNLNAATYSLLLTDAIGCTASIEVLITEPESLESSIDIELPDCDSPGGLSSLLLTANGGTAPYSITWTGPGGFASAAFELANLESGSYSFTLEDAQGCATEGEVVIPQTELLGVIAEVVNVTCHGANDGSISTQLFGGTGSLAVSWTGPGGFASQEADIADLSPGPYTILIADSAGCTLSSTFTVLEPQPFTLVLTGANDASCNTSSDGFAQVEAEGGSPPYSFAWAGPAGFVSDQSSIADLIPGIYDLSALDAQGCVAELQLAIDFLLEITADAGPDVSTCYAAQPVVLTGQSSGAETFAWTDALGNEISADLIAQLPGMLPGDYTYILSASNGICVDSDTIQVTVLPIPEVDPGPDRDVFAEQIFTLGGNPSSATGVIFEWSPSAGGDFNPGATNPSGFILETTQFTLTVTDENGCVGSDSVRVSILPGVTISSGFTPNDDGVNDRWVIDNIELFPNSVVSIFNRWGTLLYQKQAYNSGNAWDGTYNGNPVPVGTYYYAIELNEPRFPEPFTGPLTIYR